MTSLEHLKYFPRSNINLRSIPRSTGPSGRKACELRDDDISGRDFACDNPAGIKAGDLTFSKLPPALPATDVIREGEREHIVLHGPNQSGKTTALLAYKKLVLENTENIVIYVNLQQFPEQNFTSVDKFWETFGNCATLEGPGQTSTSALQPNFTHGKFIQLCRENGPPISLFINEMNVFTAAASQEVLDCVLGTFRGEREAPGGTSRLGLVLACGTIITSDMERCGGGGSIGFNSFTRFEEMPKLSLAEINKILKHHDSQHSTPSIKQFAKEILAVSGGIFGFAVALSQLCHVARAGGLGDWCGTVQSLEALLLDQQASRWMMSTRASRSICFKLHNVSKGNLEAKAELLRIHRELSYSPRSQSTMDEVVGALVNAGLFRWVAPKVVEYSCKLAMCILSDWASEATTTAALPVLAPLPRKRDDGTLDIAAILRTAMAYLDKELLFHPDAASSLKNNGKISEHAIHFELYRVLKAIVPGYSCLVVPEWLSADISFTDLETPEARRSVAELLSEGDKKKILEHYTRTYHSRPGVVEVLTVNFVVNESSPTWFWPSPAEVWEAVNECNLELVKPLHIGTTSEKQRSLPDPAKCQLHHVNLVHHGDSVWYCGINQPPTVLRQPSPASSVASKSGSSSSPGPSISERGSSPVEGVPQSEETELRLSVFTKTQKILESNIIVTATTVFRDVLGCLTGLPNLKPHQEWKFSPKESLDIYFGTERNVLEACRSFDTLRTNFVLQRCEKVCDEDF